MGQVELAIAMIGAIAAIWAAIVATIQLKRQAQRPSPFFTVERDGLAIGWPGFKSVVLRARNTAPIGFEILSVRVRRSLKRPWRKPLIAAFRHHHYYDADGQSQWAATMPTGIGSEVIYSGLVVPPAGSPSPITSAKISISGVTNGQLLLIKYRWLDQRFFSQAITTIWV